MVAGELRYRRRDPQPIPALGMLLLVLVSSYSFSNRPARRPDNEEEDEGRTWRGTKPRTTTRGHWGITRHYSGAQFPLARRARLMQLDGEP
jgi:hypothetical protein